MTDRQARLTEEELAELERLEAAATPPEWRYDGQHYEITHPRGEEYWLISSECRSAPDQQYQCDQFGHQYDANLALIAEARNHLPALLAEIRALRTERQQAEERERRLCILLAWNDGDITSEQALKALEKAGEGDPLLLMDRMITDYAKRGAALAEGREVQG